MPNTASSRINPLTGKRYNWVDPDKEKRDAKKIQAEIALLERQAMAMRARDELLTFTQFTMPDPEFPNDVNLTRYEAAAFHRAIARHLEQVERGEIKQLILTLPPRAGKTELATKRFSAWFMGRNPFDSMAITTYSDTMAEDYGADIRHIMGTPQFKQVFPRFRLRRGGASKSNIQTEDGGRIVCVGVGGALTGRGAHCFPAGTMVETVDGPVAIEKLCVSPLSVKVVNYDRHTRQLSTGRVQAFAHRQAARLLRITTASGRVVDATPDHPVFTSRGYVPADELTRGDRLMQLVRNEGPEISLRDNQKRETRAYGVLLLEPLLGALRERQSVWAAYLRRLWRAGAAGLSLWVESRQFLLLEGVFAGSPGGTEGQSPSGVGSFGLQRMRGVIQSRPITDPAPGEKGQEPGPVLQHGLQEPGARTFNDGRGQSGLPARTLAAPPATALGKGIPRYEASRSGAGWALLRALFGGGQTARSPHRSGPQGQPLAEPDLALSEVPLRPARSRAVDRSVAEDEVLRVDEVAVGNGGTAVYDIQVEGQHNFFANGVLVHNCLIVDDPVKNFEDARSQTMRDAAWEWFTKVAMTRRMGKKLVLIITTRWHSDDLIGRLTDPDNPHYNAIEAKGWKIINIPAIAEENDVLGRKPGEALWPERYDLDFLAQQQRLDPLGFAALYQQRPTVADGVLFRRENIQRYKPEQLPPNLRYYAASDHAVATGQRNDFTVFLKVGIDPQDNIYVTDCYWAKVASDVAVEAMLAMGGGDEAKRPLIWWAERGHISKSIGPFLYKRMAETGTYINIREVTPIGDKEQRSQSIAARVAMGKLYIPTGMPWAEKLIEQMLAFPNGTHDDAVDALAYIGLGLQSQFGASTPAPKKTEPKFGTLNWVKQNDRWAEIKRLEKAAGGF